MTINSTGVCRLPGCGEPRHGRHVYCPRHANITHRNGHPQALAASNKASHRARLEANRLLNLYANRKATHEALALADTVPSYPVQFGWTMERRCEAEGHLLRERGVDAREILLRALTAYVLFDRVSSNYPNEHSEWQQVGKLVLAPLHRRNAAGNVIRLIGKVVLMFGEHVARKLGPFCIGIIRKERADKAALAAAIAATTNFDEVMK